MENVFIVRRLSGRHHRDEKHCNGQVPAHAMILVNGFGVVNAAVQGRKVKLGEANQGLDQYQNVGGEADDCVRRLEVGTIVVGFVVKDDYKGGEESEKGSPVESGVDVSAESLLMGSVRRLYDQDGLCAEENPGRVEQL